MRAKSYTALIAAVVFAGLPAMASAQMSVEAVVATDVVDREPVGADSAFAADVGRVWCWTRVTGAPEMGTTLHHVWIRDGEELADVELTIGGSSWRTWSNKAIPPEWAGAWRVEIRDAEGTVLETVSFTVGG